MQVIWEYFERRSKSIANLELEIAVPGHAEAFECTWNLGCDPEGWGTVGYYKRHM